MEKIKVTGQVRNELGSKNAKNARKEGLVPCVLYSSTENVHFVIEPRAIRDLIYTPEFHTADLELGGKSFSAIVKDVQYHPLTEEILHIDFLALEPNRPVKVEVPIAFKGVSPGVKAGGKLQKSMQTVKVKTTPENMVDLLHLDISNLGLGQAIRVRDIEPVDGIEIITAAATPVAIIEIPRALRSAAAAEAKAAKK